MLTFYLHVKHIIANNSSSVLWNYLFVHKLAFFLLFHSTSLNSLTWFSKCDTYMFWKKYMFKSDKSRISIYYIFNTTCFEIPPGNVSSSSNNAFKYKRSENLQDFEIDLTTRHNYKIYSWETKIKFKFRIHEHMRLRWHSKFGSSLLLRHSWVAKQVILYFILNSAEQLEFIKRFFLGGEVEVSLDLLLVYQLQIKKIWPSQTNRLLLW